MSENSSKNYHHGDLRNTLIVAAAELIEESGSVEFALVDAARRAGVSTAAPYRHFKDKDDLLDAVCMLGYLALTERSELIIEKFGKQTELCIVELGACYLDFVIGHQPFYDLMWGDRGARTMRESQADNQARGFWLLVKAVERWCVSENLQNSDPLDLALKLWSAALGLATLSINQQLTRFNADANVHQLLNSSVLTFLEGVRQGR